MLASGNSNDLLQNKNKTTAVNRNHVQGGMTSVQNKENIWLLCVVVAYFYMFPHFYTCISIARLLNPFKEFQIILSNVHAVLFKMHHSVCEIRIGVGYQVVQEILASAASNEFGTEQKQCNCSQQSINACIEEWPLYRRKKVYLTCLSILNNSAEHLISVVHFPNYLRLWLSLSSL